MKNLTEIELLKEELAMFKKNNQELIQRHNAAIASWDEERERAFREADRVIELRNKYEELKDYSNAISFYSKLYALKSNDLSYLNKIASIYETDLKDYNSAEKYYKQI